MDSPIIIGATEILVNSSEISHVRQVKGRLLDWEIVQIIEMLQKELQRRKYKATILDYQYWWDQIDKIITMLAGQNFEKEA